MRAYNYRLNHNKGKKMFQWTIQEKVITKADIKKIWAAWTDVQNWPKWDLELVWN